MKTENPFDISEIIYKKMAEVASDRELMKLESWINTSKKNRKLYTHIISDEMITGKIRQYCETNVQEAFDLFIKRRQQWERHRLWRKRITRYAAILALPLILSVFYLNQKQLENKVPDVQTKQTKVTETTPMLTLSNGREIALEHRNLNLEEEDGTRILLGEDGGMQYTAPVSKKGEEVYNTLTTPAQCDFMFTLEDGTKVWLNARSSLRYPVVFTGKERVVYAEGEVYLEVAKDTKRPFYVVMGNDVKVRVLGTSFNVNTYRNVQVTLVSGNVQVEYKDGKKTWELRPGDQLSMANGQAEVREVNVEDYVSWKDGIYIFKGEKLEVIAEVIERWFGKQVIFLDERGKKEVFTGILDKHAEVEVFALRLSRTSNLQCVVSGNQLFIKSNK